MDDQEDRISKAAMSGLAIGALLVWIFSKREGISSGVWMLAPVGGVIGALIAWAARFLPEPQPEPEPPASEALDLHVEEIPSEEHQANQHPGDEISFVQDLRVIFELPAGPHWEEITARWMQFDFQKAQILRECQIFVNCLRNACTSRNPETSSENYATAHQLWQQGMQHREALVSQLQNVLPAEIVKKFDHTVRVLFVSLSWRMPLNEAEGLAIKAAKLKTIRGRRRHLDRAVKLLSKAESVDGCPADIVAKLRTTLAELERV